MSDTTVATHNDYMPDLASPPGETLLETLEALGMSQAELARRIGRPKKTVNEIVQGKAAITAETALQLERALSIPATFWLAREAQYRESLARLDECAHLDRWHGWLRELPLATMRKRGLISATRDTSTQVREALKFFGVASPDAWRAVWAQEAAGFCVTASAGATPDWLGKVATWLRVGELEAQTRDCAAYDPAAFRAALAQIRALTTEAPKVFLPQMTRLCADAGVTFVMTQEIPGTQVYGATRWLTPRKALLHLSLRDMPDDHFWWTFFHGAGHILLHRKKDIFLLGTAADSDEAREAHAFAANALIPSPEWQHFTAEAPHPTRAAIVVFAAGLGIAPGIIVGRLEREKLLGDDECQDLKTRYGWVEDGETLQ